MNRIFKINFNYSLFDLNGEWARLNDVDKDTLINLSAESFFDYELEDKYICYVLADTSELNKYVEILDKYNIDFKYKDISDIVLSSELDIEFELIKMVDSDNSIKYDFFIEDVNNWIVDNLDMDSVLDKISLYGINGLNELEKQFLKKYEA
jgi:hypothetical protein